MQIVIDIPKEFKVDVNDKFQDFFKRLEAETDHHMNSGTNLVCGNYELETIQMFIQAFANGTPLPKGHGRLIDADSIGIVDENFYTRSDYYEAEMAIDNAPTIIEADRSDEE